jgi:hypothetical protein
MPPSADRSSAQASPSFNWKLARNQMLFRDVNEQIRRLSLARSAAELELVCECSSDRCRTRLVIPVEEYELVRGRSGRFLVAAGHENRAVEEALGEFHGYIVVVRKPAA